MAKQEATLLLKIKESGIAILEKSRDLLADLGKAAFAAGAAIVGFAGASLKAYHDQELAVNKLNQAMVNNGMFTSELSKKYQDLATSLQKVTTFGDEEIISAQATLQSLIGRREVTEELTRATLDFAAATGTDLTTAASLVGKAISTGTNALARYGVEIDSTATEGVKLQQVIDGISSKFGGQAEAAADGTGAFIVLKNALSDLMETVGQRLAPDLIKAAKAITSFAQDADKAKPLIDGFIDTLKFLLKVAAGVKFVLVQLGDFIGTTFGLIFQTIGDVMAGRLAVAEENLATFFAKMKEDTIVNADALNQEVAAIDDLFKAETVTKEQEHQDKLNQIKSDANAKRLAAEKAAGVLSLAEKRRLAAELAKLDQDLLKLGINVNKEKVADLQSSLGQVSTLQNSHNKGLVAIGKAAAIADITISTAQGVGKAWALGPFLGPVMAALVATAGAVQLAKVAGVKMAEGGIVTARPGGMHAIIGEGGRDEAVIPLENGRVPGMGTNIIININGGLLGDESSARQLAMALDKQLLNLRRSNESVSFDERFT